MAYAFIPPIAALAYRSLVEWPILDWDGFWMPFAATGAILFALALLCVADLRKKMGAAAIVACFCVAYSLGLLLHLNCCYDRSWPVTYRSQVRSHHFTSGGRTNTYELMLSPWLNRPEEHRVVVARSVSSAHTDGAPIRSIVHAGRLGIPWYEVD